MSETELVKVLNRIAQTLEKIEQSLDAINNSLEAGFKLGEYGEDY